MLSAADASKYLCMWEKVLVHVLYAVYFYIFNHIKLKDMTESVREITHAYEESQEQKEDLEFIILETQSASNKVSVFYFAHMYVVFEA